LTLTLSEANYNPTTLTLILPNVNHDPTTLTLTLPKASHNPTTLTLTLSKANHNSTTLTRILPNVSHNPTGTCFIKKIYGPSSSLLQGKHLPFSPFPLRFNIFRLFVILSLTQLYRYTPEIFLFSSATFKCTYRAPLRRIVPTGPPSDELDKNIQRTSHGLLFSH